MFMEMSREMYEKMKPYLDSQKLQYQITNCTLPSETIEHVHLEFGELSPAQIDAINAYQDQIKETLRKQKLPLSQDRTRDTDNDGQSDYEEMLLKEEEEERKKAQPKKRRRKDEDEFIMLDQAFKNFMLGTEERED